MEIAEVFCSSFVGEVAMEREAHIPVGEYRSSSGAYAGVFSVLFMGVIVPSA